MEDNRIFVLTRKIVSTLTRTKERFAVGYGAAHGALAMTTSGDTTMVTFAALLDAIE